MKRLLKPGLMLLFCLSLLACAPQIPPAPTPPAAAGVTVYAPPVQELPGSLPEATSAQVVPTPQDAQQIGSTLVVYERSGSLWAWRGGKTTQLTSGAQDSRPRLAPDGTLVAFQRGAELWMVDVTGQNLRKVFAGQGAAPLQFEFAPRSQRLYFSTAGADGAPRFDLNVADAGTNVVYSFLPQDQAGVFTFAPDGSLLALARADRLMTMHADG